MKLTELGAKGTCISCGTETRQGGIWHGINQEVVVCPDEDCLKSLLHLAFDAIEDVVIDKGDSRRYWNDLANDVLKVKGQLL